MKHILDYSFKDQSLLDMALTHVSAVAEDKKSYERLEFLGDRILSLAIAHMLYDAFPNEEEGALAKRHSALVRQETLEKIACTIHLKDHIRVSSNEAQISGSIMSDVLEALLGALYLDGGYNVAEKFIMTHWHDLLHSETAPPEDGKSILQEWAQARGLPLPVYDIAERSGPDHKPHFVVKVTLADYPPQLGEGASKQAAQKVAAKALLQYLREQGHG
jgi:ribonuclease III